MARGYHDWLVAETAGELRTYGATISSPVGMGAATQLVSSLENLAGSGVLMRIQRLLLFPSFGTTGFNFTFTDVVARRVTAPTGGTIVATASYDTLDADSVAEFRRAPTSFGSTLATLLFWRIWWFLNTVNISDKNDILSLPLDVYTHFADGRRQPWTLRPGEAILVSGSPNDDGWIAFGCLIEYTEEPLG